MNGRKVEYCGWYLARVCHLLRPTHVFTAHLPCILSQLAIAYPDVSRASLQLRHTVILSLSAVGRGPSTARGRCPPRAQMLHALDANCHVGVTRERLCVGARTVRVKAVRSLRQAASSKHPVRMASIFGNGLDAPACDANRESFTSFPSVRARKRLTSLVTGPEYMQRKELMNPGGGCALRG